MKKIILNRSGIYRLTETREDFFVESERVVEGIDVGNFIYLTRRVEKLKSFLGIRFWWCINEKRVQVPLLDSIRAGAFGEKIDTDKYFRGTRFEKLHP